MSEVLPWSPAAVFRPPAQEKQGIDAHAQAEMMQLLVRLICGAPLGAPARPHSGGAGSGGEEGEEAVEGPADEAMKLADETAIFTRQQVREDSSSAEGLLAALEPTRDMHALACVGGPGNGRYWAAVCLRMLAYSGARPCTLPRPLCIPQLGAMGAQFLRMQLGLFGAMESASGFLQTSRVR